MISTPEDYQNGQIILVEKPLHWTSFQAVNKLKYLLINKVGLPKKFKIGHAGTLDPLATGLLLICTGKFTKRISELQGQIKRSEFGLTFNSVTDKGGLLVSDVVILNISVQFTKSE